MASALAVLGSSAPNELAGGTFHTVEQMNGAAIALVEVPPLAPGEIWSVEASPSLSAGGWSGVGR